LDADKVKTSTAKSKKIRKNRETVSIRFSPEAEAALADSKAKSVSSSNPAQSDSNRFNPVQSGTNSAEEEESPGRCSSFNNIEDINCNNPKNIGLLRRKEDSLAIIFLPIIMIFLICNFPRILLDVHELATFK
jgi:hypothetical protein